MARIVTATSTSRVYVAGQLVSSFRPTPAVYTHWIWGQHLAYFLFKISNKRCFSILRDECSLSIVYQALSTFQRLSLCLQPHYICLHFYFVGQAWGEAWGSALQLTPPGYEDYIPPWPASSICNAGAQNRGGNWREPRTQAVDSKVMWWNE